tara:strand:+ start:1081 stop:1209 length:129 start_codon:yes stop_codon:yes gene_type:complete
MTFIVSELPTVAYNPYPLEELLKDNMLELSSSNEVSEGIATV